MEAEFGQLRVCVALLEKNSSTRAETGDGYTDVEVQTDLGLDAEVIDTLTGGISHQPTSAEDLIEVESPTEELLPQGTKNWRRKKGKPVVVSIEEIKEPYFAPPLRGVQKQLNPLSNAADVRVISAPFRPPPSPLLSAPQSEMGKGGQEEKKKEYRNGGWPKGNIKQVPPGRLPRNGRLYREQGRRTEKDGPSLKNHGANPPLK